MDTKSTSQKLKQDHIPKRDFWSLAGSLKSEVSLTGLELEKARGEFAMHWAGSAGHLIKAQEGSSQGYYPN